jgi:hypothetical protein
LGFGKDLAYMAKAATKNIANSPYFTSPAEEVTATAAETAATPAREPAVVVAAAKAIAAEEATVGIAVVMF